MTTDVLADVNWQGRETEHGNVISGCHLGTVRTIEHKLDDGIRFEVYVSHPQPPPHFALIMHWSVFRDRESAARRHEHLVKQLEQSGELGLFARPFDATCQESVDQDSAPRSTIADCSISDCPLPHRPHQPGTR